MIVKPLAPRGKGIDIAVRKLTFEAEDNQDEEVLAALAREIITAGQFRERISKLLKANSKGKTE